MEIQVDNRVIKGILDKHLVNWTLPLFERFSVTLVQSGMGKGHANM